MTERFASALDHLPRIDTLDARTWRVRHRLLVVLLALHVPALFAVTTARQHSSAHAVAEITAVGLAAIAAALLRSRLAASIAATAGLMGSAALGVHLTGGLIEAHFHYFVLLGFIALYQDWRPYALAVATVVVGHGYVGATNPAAMYAHAAGQARPWLWAAVHGAFVAAACVGHVLFWRMTQREQRRARQYDRALYEGERAVASQLRSAEQLKTELIAVVSHELRTPLTAIMGFSQTVAARYDDLDRDTTVAALRAIDRQARRLDRIVRNLLAASGELRLQAVPVDASAAADAAVRAVAEIDPEQAARVHVDVPPGLMVAIGADAAREVMHNLLDNALKFAEPGTRVTLHADAVGDEIVIEVCNVGPPIPEEQRARIFEAFTQADSSDTRRHGGIGLGLHVVRQVVVAQGGRIDVRSEDGLVVFAVHLPAPAVIDATDDAAPLASAGWTPLRDA